MHTDFKDGCHCPCYMCNHEDEVGWWASGSMLFVTMIHDSGTMQIAAVANAGHRMSDNM